MGFNFGDVGAGAATGAAVAGPVGAVVGGALPIVGGIVSTLLNNSNTDSTNAANRAFQLQQQAQQNAYNLDMWNRTNAYNAPSAVMARLKAAGLNPNLVYGQVSGGYAQPAPHSAEVSYVQQPHPAMDLSRPVSEGIRAYNDIRMMSAQTSNLDAQTVNAIADATLRGHQIGLVDAQAANTVADTSLKSHQADALDAEVRLKAAETNRIQSLLPLDMALESGNIDKVSAEVDKLGAETKFISDDTLGLIARNATSMQEAVSRISQNLMNTAKSGAEISQIKAYTDTLLNSKAMSDMDILMRNNGMMPHDSFPMRVLGAFTNWLGQGMRNLRSKF